MKIETLEVAGFLPALKGMRNPMNSWDKGDTNLIDCRTLADNCDRFCGIGPNDLDLAQRLIKAGGEHRKFLRQIQVWADFDMPRYFWSEADTYKFGVKNSCSTMHKLFTTNPITKDCFVEFDERDKWLVDNIITWLNVLREEYLETKDYSLVIRAKKLLPEGYLQLRTWNTNYEELRNIYIQRRHHRLKEEWVDMFCRWVESLPYANELILYGIDRCDK